MQEAALFEAFRLGVRFGSWPRSRRPGAGPVAMDLYAVLREGEIFGMLQGDVDPDAGVLMVCRSWDAPRTKDGKARPVPAPAALGGGGARQVWRALFPQPDGSMLTEVAVLSRNCATSGSSRDAVQRSRLFART